MYDLQTLTCGSEPNGQGRGCTDDDRLAVLGVPDIWSDKPNLPAAVESTGLFERGGEWILLSHQPGEFGEARDFSPVRTCTSNMSLSLSSRHVCVHDIVPGCVRAAGWPSTLRSRACWPVVSSASTCVACAARAFLRPVSRERQLPVRGERSKQLGSKGPFVLHADKPRSVRVGTNWPSQHGYNPSVALDQSKRSWLKELFVDVGSHYTSQRSSVQRRG